MMITKKHLVLGLLLLSSTTVFGASVEIILPKDASQVEQLAAVELKTYLARLYPSDSFANRTRPTSQGDWFIFIGTKESAPHLAGLLDAQPRPEGYVVAVRELEGKKSALLLGGDPAGVLYGVYGLLEHLGYGFYLSYETAPDARHTPFSLDGWSLENHPLKSLRLVFNWHNFLSGCTGWDYPQWKQWIEQSQKMGFNYAMVHAYGNNPMFTYKFKGIEKPVGYVSTTRKGRDWGNEHVNDVRRLPGGSIFLQPEFGCEAALVPDGKRVEAEQQLMKKVFALAESRGMKIAFAIDVDTASVLPQDIIKLLPESARFHNGSMWLPLPDTKEGYGYYKTQIEALLNLYPEIDMIPIWRRSTAQEWGALKSADDLPGTWQGEYESIVEKKPEAGTLPQAVCSFALGKVAKAFRRALNELGRPEVRLATGSWGHGWVPAVAEFLPEEVTIMPLDSDYLRTRSGSFLNKESDLRVLQKASGRIMPIIWAHHDDGDYIGRPILPHENFDSTLDKLDAEGYGIIHWMTRPLDLYFKHHERQVWSSTRNESYRVTCLQMAADCFGEEQRETLGEYLYLWATDAPIFGRVTTDHFFQSSEKITAPELAVKKCKERIAMLQGVDRSSMQKTHGQWLDYFMALEKMLVSFCEDQEFGFSAARKAVNAGKYEEAKILLKRANFAGTIQQFADLSQMLGGNRGEEAMVVSLGTRWITDYLALCQTVGLEPTRINYGPTLSEPLAQGAGSYSFYVDPSGKYWSVRGKREIGRPEFVLAPDQVPTLPQDANPALSEIARTAIQIESPTSLMLSPLVNTGKNLASGNYALTLYAGPAPGLKQCEMEWGIESQESEKITVEPTRARYLKIDCKGSNAGDWNSIIDVRIAALQHDPNNPPQASKSVSGYDPARATDGDPDTRWAAQGNHWIQLPLNSDKEFKEIEIDWYMGGGRTYRFSLFVSDDGKSWQELVVKKEVRMKSAERQLLKGNSLNAPAVYVLSREISIKEPAVPILSIVPIDGAIMLYGVELAPRF